MANYNCVAWELAAELNCNYFIVQRSTDGYNFDDIGTVKGSGTTNIITAYKFNDYSINPMQTFLYYYRIKQIDNNGDYGYSNTIFCQRNDISEITAYPFPFENYLYISNNQTIVLVANCYDLTGRLLKSEKLNSQNQLNYSDLNNGMYILKILDMSGYELKAFRILKK